MFGRREIIIRQLCIAAMKPHTVHQSLCHKRLLNFIMSFPVDMVEKTAVVEAFERHNMHGSHEDVIGVSEIVKVLTFIFDKLDQKQKETIDIPLSIDLSLNWLLNVYDRYL